MNKEIQRVRNRVTRSPDPTAIEFQNIFREIMEDVSASDRRFLFVIDNLDRLPEAEAVAMWGTIRSFFLGAAETNHVRRLSNQLPTVILPIDPHAVERMYVATHGDDAPTLAQSFTDKTFDLTFRVTRPVLSDWKAYLSKQMRTVFGSHIDEGSIYITGLLLENSLTPLTGMSVTPRGINTLINQIGTLWLQWRDENIAFASIAYYAIYLTGGDVNIQMAVGSPQASIALYDPDWQRAIAAIHYGVPPEHAVQILIEQPLRTAVAERDADGFKRLSAIKGFEIVLQRVLDQATRGEGCDPTFVMNAASMLDGLQLTEQAWTSVAWATLRRGFSKPTPWQAFTTQDAPSLTALLAHCNAHETGPVLTALVDKLGQLNEGITKAPSFVADFSAVCAVAANAASTKQIALPSITVPGPTALYLNVLSACASNKTLVVALNAKASKEEVVGELVNNLSTQALAPAIEAKLRAIIARGQAMPWAKLIEAAGVVVQDQNANYFAMGPSLVCLGLLRKLDNAAKDRIKQLFDGQQLVSRFHEAHAQKLLPTEAHSVALLILTGPVFPGAEGKAWDALLKDRPELIVQIDKALLEFDSKDNLDVLVKFSTTNADAIALVRGIVSLRVREGRMGKLYTAQVIAQLPQYLSCVDQDLRTKFVQDFATYDNFWETIQPMALDANVSQILLTLATAGKFKEQSTALLTDKLKALTIDQWSNAISTGVEPFGTAMTLSESTGKTTHLGTALYDALNASIPRLLSDGDGSHRKRWFDVLDLVNPGPRQTLFRYVRDQITRGTSVTDLLGLLVAGGEVLMLSGDFEHASDGATRYVILPLLGSKEGISWLSTNALKLKSWVSASEDATRDVIVEKLSELWTAADEEGKKQYQDLELTWNLPELPIVSEIETADEETKSG